MIAYVLAAVVLVVALVMFSMALRHKTLLDPTVERDLLTRLDHLTPETQGRWGHMSVAQMLHHLGGAIRMATGDLSIPPRDSVLRRFPLKQLIVFVLPFPKGAPTAPALLAKGEFSFEGERETVRELLGTFAKRQIAEWPEHPAFGPLNRDQWGILVWKHVDHHLCQFGV